MSPFHYHGQPVSAADAIAMLKNRKDHARYRLNAKRGRDERDGTILRQLWSMIRGGRMNLTENWPYLLLGMLLGFVFRLWADQNYLNRKGAK